MRPVLDAWVRMIAVARAAGVPVIYTTPVSRSDVVLLPTDHVKSLGEGLLMNEIDLWMTGVEPQRRGQTDA